MFRAGRAPESQLGAWLRIISGIRTRRSCSLTTSTTTIVSEMFGSDLDDQGRWWARLVAVLLLLPLLWAGLNLLAG
jgi:hypothetical protein